MELVFLAILVLIMATALGSGYPVAFALPGAAILTIGLAAISGALFGGGTDAYFHTGGPNQWLSAGVTNLRGVYWEVERDTLIAIPLFIFMGIMLQRSKIAEDLLVTMAQLFGPVPGGLGISVVFVGALLAATTGIVGATVVAMGLISLPAMLRNNYSQSLATGTIAASGTLGQIIPPSIVLIILADQLASATDQAGTARKALYKEATGELTMPSVFEVASTSAGEMFLGALVPGILLVLLYMAYILVFAIIKPSSAPSVPYLGKFDMAFWRKVFLTLVPPLALIFMVLGSIITGVATVNQAGAIGAAGALIMAGYRLTEGQRSTYLPAILALTSLVIIAFALQNYPMNIKAASTTRDSFGIAIGAIATLMLMTSLVWSGIRVFRIEGTLQGVMLETAKTTSLVFIILLGAAMLTAAFRAFGGEDLVRDFLNALPGGFWSQFIIVMAVIFFLGFFLDFIEIAVVVVPIVAPILLADPSANITAVWLGVMIGLNIQTSFLTPPFGFALFYLRGVAPAVVTTINMYKGVIAFIGLQLVALLVVGLFPPLVNYLPSRLSLLSETSPPPRNPKLQICLEEYVGEKLAGDVRLAAAIAAAKSLDVSFLPKSMAKDLSAAFEDAGNAGVSLEAAFAASVAVEQQSKAYRPQLIVVRRLEKQIRKAAGEIKELDKQISRMRSEADAQRKLDAQDQRGIFQAEIDRLTAETPATWPTVFEAFNTLNKAERKARLTYRRSADNSYETAAEMLAVLNANAEFAALESELTTLRATVEASSPADTHELVNDLSRKFRGIAGGDDVKSALSKARRELKSKSPDLEDALKEYDKAIAAYEIQKTWRTSGETDLRAGLTTYLDAIRGTLGARMQPKLTREQALFLAACSSIHRDISLSF
ncbi:MAG: tripartite ATP-independent transporter DctM subunit [Paracoccaceae bacterium]|jgi:tripartite ATP-independent transporter DctM subunit